MRVGRALAMLLVFTLLLVGSVPVLGVGSQSGVENPYDLIEIDLPPRNRAGLEAAYRRSLPPGSGVGAATVFSPDDRWQVTDTTPTPFRTIVQVVVFDEYDEIDSTCSGVLLTSQVVLTAAHCLYSGGAYAGGVLVVPGQSGSYWPYGTGYGFRMAVPNGWANGRGASNDPYGPPSPFDWGIVVLDIVDWDTSLGPFPVVATASDAFFAEGEFLLGTAGYPGDKPIGTMWAAESWNYFVDETYLYTDADIYEGQSGSPIFALHPDGSFIFSVVSGGNEYFNRSVRFTPAVTDALERYAQEFGLQLSTYVFLDDVPSPTPTRTPTHTVTPTPTSTPSPSPTVSPTTTVEPDGTPNPRPFRLITQHLSRD